MCVREREREREREGGEEMDRPWCFLVGDSTVLDVTLEEGDAWFEYNHVKRMPAGFLLKKYARMSTTNVYDIDISVLFH